MRASNWLANIFDFFGDALEKFNPSAFRFLAASLPYLTPIPVAWLTAHSASTFLEFPPTVAFIFVFALEGLGLWFTTLLVDAVVDWVRIKNWQSFFPVVLFVIAVGAYIYLLVNLNVTLEQATGNVNPARSTVITLMCFLPLITGIGNGYYKLKVERKTESQFAMEREERLERERRQAEDEKEIRILQERSKASLERLRIKAGNLPNGEKLSSNLPESYQEGEKVSGNFPTDWRKIRPRLESYQIEFIAKHEPKEIVESLSKSGFPVSPRTASNWRVYARKELGME